MKASSRCRCLWSRGSAAACNASCCRGSPLVAAASRSTRSSSTCWPPIRSCVPLYYATFPADIQYIQYSIWLCAILHRYVRVYNLLTVVYVLYCLCTVYVLQSVFSLWCAKISVAMNGQVGLDGTVCVANRTASETKKIQGAIKDVLNVRISHALCYLMAMRRLYGVQYSSSSTLGGNANYWRTVCPMAQNSQWGLRTHAGAQKGSHSALVAGHGIKIDSHTLCFYPNRRIPSCLSNGQQFLVKTSTGSITCIQAAPTDSRVYSSNKIETR